MCAGKKILIRIRSERQGVTPAHNFYDKYVNWYKATEEKGQQKLATCFATLLQNELKNYVARFTTHESNLR